MVKEQINPKISIEKRCNRVILLPEKNGLMCGVSGSIHFQLPEQRLKSLMHHRGPDDQQAWTNGIVHFFHFRLSIVDIAGGAQPMHLDNRYHIIFNGEIYNHLQIREAEQLQGNTTSDTETLLLLYRKMGMRMLDLLEGMFVFALYDDQEDRLIIARDRAGKKPLYYYTDGSKFIFASELNALKGILPLEKDDRHLLQYLRLGSFHGTATPYKNVQELPGGAYLEVNTRSLDQRVISWWSIDRFYEQSSTLSEREALEKTNQLLHEAVKRRIESSDLEVGCFLSGGIDSGLVTAIASQYHQNLKTFTVSFSGAYDEGPLAKQVADQYRTRHTEIPISFDHLNEDVETIISNYGEPFFDSSAIPSYYVSREARKHLTVILNGDGADELFGGYRRYVPFAKFDFFRTGTALKSAARIAGLLLPRPNDKKSKYNYLYRLAQLSGTSGLETYLAAGVDIFEGYQSNLLSAEYPDYLQPLQEEFERITRRSSVSGLKKLMNLDFNINLFDDLLVKMDIATMAHSLEGRSPFLSRDLLEFAPTLPDHLKIQGGTTKYLLRKLAEQYLPADLWNQPKRGFEIPLKNWVNHELKDVMMSYLLAPQALHTQLLNRNFTQQLIEGSLPVPPEKRAKMLWTLFSLECWYVRVYQGIQPAGA